MRSHRCRRRPLVTDTLTIDGRFNGPPASANGGYTCGLLAQALGEEAAEVSLRSPPPLDTPLALTRHGGRVEARHGSTLVAEGGPAELLLDVPDAVPAAEIAAAEPAGLARWTEHHPFPTCVVCGPARDAGDGMRIFPVELPRRAPLFGARWTPEAWLADDRGRVRPECVWAALDCPTSAPVANFGEGPPMVLARLAARLGCSALAGEEHSIVSWPLEVAGRKRHSGAALFDSGGRMLCAARALWIELRPG